MKPPDLPGGGATRLTRENHLPGRLPVRVTPETLNPCASRPNSNGIRRPKPPSTVSDGPCSHGLLVGPKAGTGISTRSSIRLRLSASPYDPTHPGTTNVALEPLVFQRQGSSPCSRYSCLHSHSHTVHGRVPPPLRPGVGRSPTTRPYGRIRVFGGVLEPRYIVGAEPLDQ